MAVDDAPGPVRQPGPSAALQREWVLCAIAAAGSRFLPVPLADDLVKDRATRTAVARTWRAHGRTPAPGVVAVLSGDTTGTLTSLRRTLARLPLTLLLYPFRKLRLWVTAVQGVSGDLLQVLVLARSVDRCLASGWFDLEDERELRRRARLVRRAHDRAIHGGDLRALQLALGAAVRQVRGLSRQARGFARDAFGRRAGPIDGRAPVTAEVPDAGPGGLRSVRDGAEQVEAVLGRPESLRILGEFDARFDAALAALSGAGPAPSSGRDDGGDPAVTPPSAKAG